MCGFELCLEIMIQERVAMPVGAAKVVSGLPVAMRVEGPMGPMDPFGCMGEDGYPGRFRVPLLA